MDATFVVLISFVIFIGIAFRLGYRLSIDALDDKIDKIRQSLNDATQAKEAALQALNDERRRHEEIVNEIELITKRTEEQTLLLRQQALQDIEAMIASRQQAAENMIKRIHHAAIQKIQEEVTTKTITTFEAIVSHKYSAAQKQALNDTAIAQICDQVTKGRAAYSQKAKRLKSKRASVR